MPTRSCRCHHCGASVDVPQAFIGHHFACPGCRRTFTARVSPQSIAVTARPVPRHERVQAMTLEFLCPQDGKRFTSLFIWNSATQKFEFTRGDYGTGTLENMAYGDAVRTGRVIAETDVEIRRFQASQVHWGEWACRRCGETRRGHCPACGSWFCAAYRRHDGYDECPGCGHADYYTATLDAFDAETVVFRKAADALPQRTPDARLSAPRDVEIERPRLIAAARKLLTGGKS
jgi:hypothetical protein